MTAHTNIYKYTVIEHMQNPPSFGGNWDYGSYTRVYMSRSPKKALGMTVRPTTRQTGVDGVPIMEERILEKGGKVIFHKWD